MPAGRPKGSRNAQRLHPLEQARRQKLAKRKYDDEKKPERRFRFRLQKKSLERATTTGEGLRASTPTQLNRPPLTYIDGRGRIHREDYRSAEELIAKWRKEHHT